MECEEEDPKETEEVAAEVQEEAVDRGSGVVAEAPVAHLGEAVAAEVSLEEEAMETRVMLLVDSDMLVPVLFDIVGYNLAENFWILSCFSSEMNI